MARRSLVPHLSEVSQCNLYYPTSTFWLYRRRPPEHNVLHEQISRGIPNFSMLTLRQQQNSRNSLPTVDWQRNKYTRTWQHQTTQTCCDELILRRSGHHERAYHGNLECQWVVVVLEWGVTHTGLAKSEDLVSFDTMSQVLQHIIGLKNSQSMISFTYMTPWSPYDTTSISMGPGIHDREVASATVFVGTPRGWGSRYASCQGRSSHHSLFSTWYGLEDTSLTFVASQLEYFDALYTPNGHILPDVMYCEKPHGLHKCFKSMNSAYLGAEHDTDKLKDVKERQLKGSSYLAFGVVSDWQHNNLPAIVAAI